MSQGTKKTPAKKAADHPPYTEMIKAAVLALKERTGSSRQAIEKYIQTNYQVGDSGSHLKTALKRMVASGKLLQTKGVGASGSFKLPKEEKKPAKKAAPVKKKPAAKPKKPSVKKTTITKTVAKKEAKKPAVKAKPSKKAIAKKPTAKPTSVNKSSPKKPTGKTAAKPSTKKTVAKKTSAKK